jgi:hypothetical protein
MMLHSLLSVVAVMGMPAGASQNAPKPAGTPLGEAIRLFNARAAEDRIGKDQPPLTMGEVLAAIRWWRFDRRAAPVEDSEFEDFQKIAETGVLPPGAALEVIRGFQPTDQIEFTAWSVRIRMPRGSGSYAYVIRNRMISWRPIGPAERGVMEKWNRQGIGSFERPRYFRELEEGRKRDESNTKRNP